MVARVRQFLLAAHADPFAAEYALLLGAEHLRAAIPARRAGSVPVVRRSYRIIPACRVRRRGRHRTRARSGVRCEPRARSLPVRAHRRCARRRRCRRVRGPLPWRSAPDTDSSRGTRTPTMTSDRQAQPLLGAAVHVRDGDARRRRRPSPVAGCESALRPCTSARCTSGSSFVMNVQAEALAGRGHIGHIARRRRPVARRWRRPDSNCRSRTPPPALAARRRRQGHRAYRPPDRRSSPTGNSRVENNILVQRAPVAITTWPVLEIPGCRRRRARCRDT